MTFNPFSLPKGLNEAVIRELSAAKNEPEWMLEFPFEIFETFKDAHANLGSRSIRDWLWWFDLLSKPSDKPARSWDEVPENHRNLWAHWDSEAERAYLAGLLLSMNRKWFTTIWKKSLKRLGIIFTDTDSALKKNTQTFSNSILRS